MTKVFDGVNAIYGTNFCCNTYVIEAKSGSSSEKVLVDPGLERPLPEFMDLLAADNITADEIKTIVCTHCHYDHTGLLFNLQKATNAQICAHPLDADAISTGDSRRTAGFGFQPVPVARLLNEGEKIGNFEILHTPGHTQGSICLFDPLRSILISGDTVFADGIGRTDLPTGSTDDLRTSLEKLSKLEVQALLPGHGPIVKENAGSSIQSGLSIVDQI